METTSRRLASTICGLGEQVAALDALGEGHLLVGGQQRHPADLAQVEAKAVEAGLDGQVELGRRSVWVAGVLAR